LSLNICFVYLYSGAPLWAVFALHKDVLFHEAGYDDCCYAEYHYADDRGVIFLNISINICEYGIINVALE
jgi:hypothetical protein